MNTVQYVNLPFRHGLGWIHKGVRLSSQCPTPFSHSSVLFLPFLCFTFPHCTVSRHDLSAVPATLLGDN